jgi:transposase InsO family protein
MPPPRPRRARISSNRRRSERALARELGVTVDTVRRWRKRTEVQDASHTPHRLQTTLTPMQEAVAVEIRRTLLLPLDDLLVVVREFLNPMISRSGLDRCLRRHGVAHLRDLIPEAEDERAAKKTFKDYVPGFIHIDIKYLPQMPDEKARRYLFVAIDRTTRCVYLRLYADQSAVSSTDFLRHLRATAPMKIVKVLTDNQGSPPGDGSQFTDRFTGKRKTPSAEHAFDRECMLLGIEHRLIPSRHPQTHGMVERFNGRISDVLATTASSAASNWPPPSSATPCSTINTFLKRHSVIARHSTPCETGKQSSRNYSLETFANFRDHASPLCRSRYASVSMLSVMRSSASVMAAATPRVSSPVAASSCAASARSSSRVLQRSRKSPRPTGRADLAGMQCCPSECAIHDGGRHRYRHTRGLCPADRLSCWSASMRWIAIVSAQTARREIGTASCKDARYIPPHRRPNRPRSCLRHRDTWCLAGGFDNVENELRSMLQRERPVWARTIVRHDASGDRVGGCAPLFG